MTKIKYIIRKEIHTDKGIYDGGAIELTQDEMDYIKLVFGKGNSIGEKLKELSK